MIKTISLVCAGVVLAAVSFFATAVRSAPAAQQSDKSMEAARLNNLGSAYMNQQLFEKALKAFEQAAELDPKLSIAAMNQGIAVLNLGRIDAARRFLEQAVRRNPDNPYAWYNLGMLEKNSANAQAAVDAFRRVSEIDPNDADTWYFLGASYAQNKQYAEAIDAFQHALKLNPLHASAEFGLSRAYQQSADLTHAREHLTRFQYITQNKLGSPISLAYGEQGKYSLAEESPEAPEKAPPAIKVKFVDVTSSTGIVSKPAAQQAGLMNLLPGPGACFIDYDNDGRIDLFLTDNGPRGGMVLWHNLGSGKFEDVTRKAGLDPTIRGTACAVGDYDGDGFPDIATTFTNGTNRIGLLLFHNQKDGTFKEVSETAGLKVEGDIAALTFIDYDHDGDLDLYLTRNVPGPLSGRFGGGNVMWRTNGNGTFTDVTAATGLAGSSSVAEQMVGTDYNNDRAIDIVVAGSGLAGMGLSFAGLPSPPGTTIFENRREGQFKAVHPWPTDVDATGVAVLDFNHDGWMDLAFTQWGAPGLTLWRNDEGKSFKRVELPATKWVRAWGVAAIDYDNDGWIDLVAVGETADGHGEARLFRNLGPDGFKDVTADVGLDKIQLKEPRAIITGDYDNDGATDLLITQNHGPAVLLRNEGGNKNHWLRLNLKGLADNKSAIGTKVEVFSAGTRQKFEIAGSSGYLGQNSPYLTVGLGQANQADVVRMLWPTGVLQDEVEVAADREQKYLEMNRRGSSCPTLFVWDGQRYKLVGDMLGAGVVGHWVGPGQRDIPRPTEYIKIDHEAVREKDGKLSFRFMEPLEEAVYLDQVKLLAVDHPAGLEVYPNEYFASNPPYPPFKVVVSRDARPPAAAHDEHGHNVLPDLLAHRYFGDFKLTQFAGFAKFHSQELDLGEPYRGGPLWLLLHGEVEYYSANSMYAASQAGVESISPYVEALDANGKWIRVIDDMGFPAGGPRTMTADLTGKLPPGTRRIRISTNLQIYWNSILIDRTSQDRDVRLTAVPLTQADLRFHGFPLKIEGTPPGNVAYVYENASPTGPYTRPAGTYTRYGDVLPLLTSLDDRLVVFGSGDEVALDFDPSGLPTLPKGWARDYFFVANGYEKDMDFYAYDFTSVDPLPFRDMGGYPYPSDHSFPLDDAHLNYILEFNTRYLSGNEARGYRFAYPSAK
jgi:tetratricopeptide (TPR) repeat protein